uniref:Uncharacterized protein n=1 Tax=Podoviridae sp. ctZ5d16 TaxID=2825257 RepID=A0A8S5Q7Z4_9CAUD|nr:MAG TPA: hypothetical protein [Podoviridae sp. ctZ5d16]
MSKKDRYENMTLLEQVKHAKERAEQSNRRQNFTLTFNAIVLVLIVLIEIIAQLF